MAEPVLAVRGLTVQFDTRHGPVTALHDVSFTIRRGEILGVVGESGAGKSVTGAAIIGLMGTGRIARGSVHLGGLRLDTLPPAALRQVRGKRIGTVFQDPSTSLDPLMRIGDQFVETIRTHRNLSARQARASAIELLDRTGIVDPASRFDSYPHEFSGGMRQRVVIALALCGEPELLIADEPTTALDVSVQAQIMRLLTGLCRERGTAVLLITHDMGVIAEYADRVAVMYAGRVVEIGPVADVVRRPSHPYSDGLMKAVPPLARRAERLVQIPGAMPRLTALPPGCTFHPRCPRAFAPCDRRPPRAVPAGTRLVACHLYDGEAA